MNGGNVNLRNKAQKKRPASVAACPACKAADCPQVLRRKNFPTFIYPMPAEEARHVETKDLVIHGCPKCGHLFQTRVDGDLIARIYGRYYAHYPSELDGAFLPVYREPFNRMYRLLVESRPRPPGARLLEIGCSKPENMTPFRDDGFLCTGIDPSPLTEMKPPRGIRIISGFYETTAIPDRAHVIVSRFSLEHVADAPRHVARFCGNLEDDGLVLVQVPNTDFHVRNGTPLFASHEHIQYFTLNSLCAMFQRFGLSPVTFYESGQPSVLACFRKGGDAVAISAVNLYDLLPAFKASARARAKAVRSALASEKHAVVYGSGMTLIWMLTELTPEERRKITLVDDNSALWGKCIPVYGVEVREPTAGLLRRSPLIVLGLNPLYHDRVIRRLRSWNVRSRLVVVGKDRVKECSL